MTRPTPSRSARRAPALAVLALLAGISLLLADPLPAADQARVEEEQDQAPGAVEQPTEQEQGAAAVHADAAVVVWDEETGTYGSPGSQLTPETIKRLQEIWEHHEQRKGEVADDADFEEFVLPDGTIGARVPVSLWSAAIVRVGDDGRMELRFVDGAGVPEPEKRYQEPPPPLEVAEE